MAHRSPPGTLVYSTDLPTEAVSFDVDAFDEAVRSHGVTFVHWRAMKCPVGMIDEYDSRRVHEDHSGCSNGFLYTRAGAVTCLFTGNSTQSQIGEVGIMDGSMVSVTLPRFYDPPDASPIYIAPFDRLYLAEESIVVPDWQVFRHEPTGIDKLNFPAVSVQDLVDSRGIRYHRPDFEINDGKLVWSGTRPGVDPDTGRGLVCSIRYTYRPYWYVKSLVHEVRVSQAENPLTGLRETNRMPQAIVLQREYVYEKNERDRFADTDVDRQVKQPDLGSRFGAR